VEHRVDKAKQFFGREMTGVAFIDELAKLWIKILGSVAIRKVIILSKIVRMEGKDIPDIVSRNGLMSCEQISGKG
jgi:hypothetical protein